MRHDLTVKLKKKKVIVIMLVKAKVAKILLMVYKCFEKKNISGQVFLAV